MWQRIKFWRPGSRRQVREADLERELRTHIELEAEEQQEAGMPPEDAHYAARRALGNTTQIKEDVRAMWGFQWLETLLQDLRYGLRQLRRNPGFMAVVVITLAVAIGANTAIFSVVDAVLLRPLPFRNASSLMALHESIPKMGFPKMSFAVPDFEVFQRDQKSFSTLGVFRNQQVDLSGQGEPERVMEARVSASLFPMLGAEAALGRLFTPQEDVPGIHVALLSYGLWQHRYGGAPA
ncbi:MAG: permease prefix domain 1-containing protein, partial [Terriglobia bacterium]